MFYKRASNKPLSPAKISWQKFLSSKVAVISLGWIILNIIVAILGYLITPDSTPFANRQQLEIRTEKPGFRVKSLFVTKNQSPQSSNIFQKMLFGESPNESIYPIHSIEIENDEAIVYSYSGNDDIPGQMRVFNLADIVYALDTEKKPVKIADSLKFTLYDGTKMVQHIDDLKAEVKNRHICEQFFILGTDQFGRDLLSQLLVGTRVSLSVGFIAVMISLIIGVSLGSLAGFFRGKVDDFIVWLINVVWSLPTLIVVIAITFAIGKGFWQVFVAVGLTMWVEVARVTRGQIISLREKEFVESARALGIGAYRIITKHILPNIYGPLIIISAANFASAILIESGLSFLGMGVQPPIPSWGSMIKENYGYIILDKAYLAILPGLFIMLMVLSFLMAGNSLRDALDKTYTN